MRIISYINHNIPIWSMLSGDHALKSKVNTLNPDLISRPNFLNPLENNLRSEVFKSQRNWIAQKMGPNPSFALVQFSYQNLRDFNTCFKDITFKQLVSGYEKAHANDDDFKVGDLRKSYNDVDDMFWMMKKVKKDCFSVKQSDVTSHLCLNEHLSYALNRSIIMKDGNSFYVLDGTHRLTAYYLAAKRSESLPNDLYGFCFEKSYT